MGRVRNKRNRCTKNKEYKKRHDTKRRRRDIDQIQDDLKKEKETGKTMAFEYDEDLPGMGQYYCTPCGRHFINQETLEAHIKSKLHKRRLKDVAQEQYTHQEAERGAGRAIEKLPPAHGKESKSEKMEEVEDQDGDDDSSMSEDDDDEDDEEDDDE